MLAVLFGVLSGVFFGALFVAVRRALASAPEPEVGATVAASIAFVVSGLLALASWPSVRLGQLWPFVLSGCSSPACRRFSS